MRAFAMVELKVLAVGMPPEVLEAVRTLKGRVAPYAGRARIEAVSRLPDNGVLTGFRGVLIDAGAPPGDRVRLGRHTALARRSRVVVDLRIHDTRRLWAVEREEGPALLVIGDRKADSVAAVELRRLLFSDFLCDRLDPVLGRVCSPAQRAVVEEFLKRAGVSTPASVAREFYRTPRAVRMRCSKLALPPPQRLLLIGRVARGITEAEAPGGTLAEAHWAAGYRDRTSFLRAARNVFDATPTELLSIWGDSDRLTDLFGRVLQRSDNTSGSAD